MLNGHSNPYIESTTVLSDTGVMWYYQVLHNDIGEVANVSTGVFWNSAIINYYIMTLEMCVTTGVMWNSAIINYYIMILEWLCVVSTGVMWNSAIINYYIMILEMCVIKCIYWCDVEFCYYQLL